MGGVSSMENREWGLRWSKWLDIFNPCPRLIAASAPQTLPLLLNPKKKLWVCEEFEEQVTQRTKRARSNLEGPEGR